MADARSRVELIVDAVKALNPLRKVKNETRQLEKAVKGAQGNLRKTNATLRDTGRAAKIAESGVNRLGSALTGLVGAFTAFQAARFVIVKTAELEQQAKSLEVLTGSLETAKNIITELQGFAAVTPFTSAELIEQAKRLKAFGVETENLVDVTKRLGDVAGATGADLGGIATAFGQIQAKGRLQGEELLQLQERGVDLQGTLREAYGLTAAEFQKALSAGRIGADAVNFALVKLTETGGKYADGAISQSTTLAGKFSTLQDNIGRIARAIGEVLAPALKRALDVLNSLIAKFLDLEFGLTNIVTASAKLQLFSGAEGEGLDTIQRAIDSVNLGLVDSETKAKNAQAAIDNISDALKIVTSDPQAVERQYPAISRLIDQLDFLRNTLKAVRQEGFPEPSAGGGLTLPTLGTGTDPGKEQLRIQKELEAAAQRRIDTATAQRQIELDLEKSFQNQLDSMGSANALLQAKLDGNEQEVAYEQQIESLVNKYGEDKRAQIELLVNTNKELSEKVKLEQQAAEEAKRLQAIYDSLGSTIANGVVNMLDAAFDRTKSLADAAGNMLRNLANQLLQLGINTLLSGTGISLFKNLPGLAKGGTAMANQPYIVGEKGPELFVPGKTGTVVPNNAMGGIGNITVNVDAGGSNVQGDAAQAKALGAAIGAAVQSEILKQKKPGGLLY